MDWNDFLFTLKLHDVVPHVQIVLEIWKLFLTKNWSLPAFVILSFKSVNSDRELFWNLELKFHAKIKRKKSKASYVLPVG